jgi:hypothetical protein
LIAQILGGFEHFLYRLRDLFDAAEIFVFAREPDVGDVVGGTLSRGHTTTDFL